MQTNDTNTPTEISETNLDEISGGPHFRNFHGTSFDFQSATSSEEGSEPRATRWPTSNGWDNVKHTK